MNRYLMLFAVVAILGCTDSNEGGLIIKNNSLLVDTIYSNEKKASTITLYNFSQKVVSIEKIVSECGCIAYTGIESKKILPNDSILFVVEYTPTPIDSAYTEKSIVIQSDFKKKLVYHKLKYFVKKTK